MGYVERVLQPGETVRYRSRITWTTYLPWLLLLIAGFVPWLALRGFEQQSWLQWTGLVLAGIVWLVAVVKLIHTWFIRWTTEIAITDRRIIFKRGFINRRTIEMQMDKVESVDVVQSVLGRLFDYGDILVRGAGTGFAPLKGIDSPLEFRNHVTAT